MPFITTVKTDYGFEYLIGTLVIARADWVMRQGKWKVRVNHMTPRTTKIGLLALDYGKIMPIDAVSGYLHGLMEPPEAEAPDGG